MANKKVKIYSMIGAGQTPLRFFHFIFYTPTFYTPIFALRYKKIMQFYT